MILKSNHDHVNQTGCHINMAVFLEISVFGQCVLVLRIVYVPKVVYVTLEFATVFIYLLRTVLAYLFGTKPFRYL